MHSRFSPAEHANFIAAKAVSYATSFLNERADRELLGRNAQSVMIELVACGDDPAAKAILDPARLLTIAMIGAAGADNWARRMRWCDVMSALVIMVRQESHELRRTGAQRS